MAETENVSKKKVLLSFVGNNDPFGKDDQPGSVLTLCEKLRPDILCLFPSCRKKNPDNNTEENAEWVQGILKKDHKNLDCRIYPMDVKDATDFEEIITGLKNNIDARLSI